MKTTIVTISKVKQIIHAYMPLLLLFLLPKGFTAVVAALAYIVFTGYVYLKKANEKYPSIYWEYYMLNLLLTLIVLGGYVNGI